MYSMDVIITNTSYTNIADVELFPPLFYSPRFMLRKSPPRSRGLDALTITKKYIIEKFDVDWSQMVLIICYTLV